MSILEVKNVTLSMGGKNILNNISMDVWKGYIHAIVGPNGAGKSTLSNTIMGLSNYRDIEGDILFEGKSIKHLDVSERSKKGITLAWQEPARFEGLTVRQFLSAGAKDKSEDNLKNAQDAQISFLSQLEKLEDLYEETNTNNIVGDFDIDFKLTNNGKVHVKAFNRANDNLLLQTSPYTQGVGIFYREDFNSFEDLMQRYKNAIRRLFTKKEVGLDEEEVKG